MTFADLLYKAWTSMAAHRTKIAGTATTVVGFMSLYPAVVSPHALAIAEFALGLVTIFCGVANTSTIAAKVAAMQNPTSAPTGAPPESK